MDIQVKEVSFKEDKSVQEIEKELLEKHEQQHQEPAPTPDPTPCRQPYEAGVTDLRGARALTARSGRRRRERDAALGREGLELLEVVDLDADARPQAFVVAAEEVPAGAVGELLAVVVEEQPADLHQGDGAGQLLLAQELVADGRQAELLVQRVGLLEGLDHGVTGLEHAGEAVVHEHAGCGPQVGRCLGVEGREVGGVAGEVVVDRCVGLAHEAPA